MPAPLKFGARARRLLRHLCSTALHGRRLFAPPTLAAMTAAITAGEQRHRAQLRLIVESAQGMGQLWRGVSNRERAVALFAQYGLWDTEENCGVLIYVNLAERAVDIVADRNIGRKVSSEQWHAICRSMTEGYARGQFHDSTLAAIAQVNAILAQHFPASGKGANELPDQAIVL